MGLSDPDRATQGAPLQGPLFTILSPFLPRVNAAHSLLVMRTSHVKASDTEERWFVYDASEHILGRMATKIATQLMGKDRPTWTPSEHGNTHVVVINAGKARLTGKKDGQKEYQTYSGYPGGQYIWPIEVLRERRPRDIVELAVKRMLPKGRLGARIFKNLKVYGESEHPHSAQQPTKVEATLS